MWDSSNILPHLAAPAHEAKSLTKPQAFTNKWWWCTKFNTNSFKSNSAQGPKKAFDHLGFFYGWLIFICNKVCVPADDSDIIAH